MARPWHPRRLLSDDEWRYALVVGLVSVPFTVTLYWQSLPGFSHPFEPVFVAGLVGGYLAHRDNLGVRRVGARIGLVGALPVLWPVIDVLAFVFGLGQSVQFIGGATAIVGFVTVVIVGVSAVIGAVGALLGAWLLEQFGNSRPAPDPVTR